MNGSQGETRTARALTARAAPQMAISRVYREAVDPLLPPAPGVRTPPLPPHVRMGLCTGTAPPGAMDAAAQDAAGAEGSSAHVPAVTSTRACGFPRV